ncbi:outer-membrane lipoprotein carrier protein [Pseudoxanthomonas indica]|nr:outer-membrane lipoprotein carrier protein [Pseudoxanthomonas indica]
MLASLLVGLAPSTRAADDLSVVQQRVAQVEVLRGGFEQEKRIAGFKNPLRSQGSFLVARGKGVVWTTLKPFPSEVVITGDRILSRQRDGSTRVEVDGREQPALRSVNAMMFALVSGDVAALSSRFDTQVQARAGNAWTLALTPKSAALAKAFRRITLNGDRYVRDVDIEEANGDHTHLRFVDLSQTPAQLSVDEARRFD